MKKLIILVLVFFFSSGIVLAKEKIIVSGGGQTDCGTLSVLVIAEANDEGDGFMLKGHVTFITADGDLFRAKDFRLFWPLLNYKGDSWIAIGGFGYFEDGNEVPFVLGLSDKWQQTDYIAIQIEEVYYCGDDDNYQELNGNITWNTNVKNIKGN
ncbi:MAG: hypothetical protein R6U27_13655 [Desulfobacterales bacterium]